MIDVYVLDGNLNPVGVIDAYNSLIWANRYHDTGDCELYLVANMENINLLQMGRYLARLDDEMVCRIDRLEIDTSSEDGNYLTATGHDVKRLCDKRILWYTETCDGNVETFIRGLVSMAMIDGDSARIIRRPDGTVLVRLGAVVGFTEESSEQMSYDNLGEKIREFCVRYGWGYRMTMDAGQFVFELYKGTDRHAEVFFSDDYENLSSTSYADDCTNLGNVALVGGTGEGANRIKSTYGSVTGIDRDEIFVDARTTARDISWKELTEIYPTTSQGGTGSIVTVSGKYIYRLSTGDIQIITDEQLASLQAEYPNGTVITSEGNRYYRVANLDVADLTTASPSDSSICTLREVIYTVYLLTRGAKEIAEYGEVISFEGAIVPDVTFVYKKDYFLGDIVTVENEYGISKSARIVEVVEVVDDNGYSIQPKFELKENV